MFGLSKKQPPPAATTVQKVDSSGLVKQLQAQQPGGAMLDSAFMDSPAGDRIDSTGRFQTASGVAGYGFTRPVGDRRYDVQAFTGYAMGTVPGTQWNRGFLYRANTPALRIPNQVGMIDPTDPATWVTGSYF